MILVTLGTGDKTFPRLLEAIEGQLESGKIKDEVIVQAGVTKYESKYMKIFDLLPIEELNNLIKKCDILITHGGVGSITTGLKYNKKIIGVARLKKYGEAVSDHQLQILENFDNKGFLIHVKDLDNIPSAIKRVKNFQPQKYKSNTNNMIKVVENYIKENSK